MQSYEIPFIIRYKKFQVSRQRPICDFLKKRLIRKNRYFVKIVKITSYIWFGAMKSIFQISYLQVSTDLVDRNQQPTKQMSFSWRFSWPLSSWWRKLIRLRVRNSKVCLHQFHMQSAPTASELRFVQTLFVRSSKIIGITPTYPDCDFF